MAQLKSTNITGNLAVTGNILASKIIKLGGTTHEVLLADGTVAKVSTTAQTVAPNAVTATTARTYIVQKNGDQLVVNVPWVKGESSGGTLTEVNLVGGDGITLSSNTIGSDSDSITISHGDTSSQESITTGGRTYINSITLDEHGHVTALDTGTETVTAYSLPLAANGTRGGIQIGYSNSNKPNNLALQLDSEKAYVTLPTRLSHYKSSAENTPDTSGFYFFNDTNNTSAKTAFDNSAQAATWVSAYDNKWAGQLGISYYSDNIAFRRKQNSTTWGDWIGIATKAWVEGKGYLTAHQSLAAYVQGPSTSTANAIVRFNGTGGKTVKNSTAVIDDTGNLALNNSSGGDISLELKRSTNADWRVLGKGGNLYFQNNWTTAKGNYYDVLSLNYNSGNVSVDKGTLTSKGGFIHGNLTAASGKTKNDYVLLAGGGTKAVSEIIASGSAGVDLTGYVTGTDLTTDTIILGNSNSQIKTSSKTIVITIGADDTTVPTSKAVKDYINDLTPLKTDSDVVNKVWKTDASGVPGWRTDSNSDTKVTQTVTSSSNTSKRPILLGYSYSDAATPSFSTVTNTAYASHNIYVAPKDGYLYAAKLYSDGKEVLTSHQSLSGYVTGSGLTADTIMLGNGSSSIKTSSKTIATSVGADDTTVPTSKAVKDYVTGLGYITGSYLPLSGGTMTGAITLPENKMALKFRTHATSYETGLVYGTTGNEALTFAIQNPVTAFQIVYGTKPSVYGSNTWQGVTPLFQTKDGKVIINRKITTTADTTNLKLLDVNGDIGANGIFVNNITCGKILAPTTSGGTTYGVGTNGQVLKSNGTTVYWGTDSSGSGSDQKTSSSNQASTKLLIVGAQSASTSGVTTYTNSGCYIGTDNCLYSNGKKVATEEWVEEAVNDTIDSVRIYSQAQIFNTNGTPTGHWVDGYYNVGAPVGGYSPEGNTSTSYTNQTVTTSGATMNLRAPYSKYTARERWVLEVNGKGLHGIALSGASYTLYGSNSFIITFNNSADGRTLTITKGDATFTVTVNFQTNSFID